MNNAIYYGMSGPPVAGGHHVNVHHVAALRKRGLRAYLLYWPAGTTIERFEAKAPVLLFGPQMVFQPDDIVVLPEGWRKPLAHFGRLPCRKVLHCQNPHYVFGGVDDVAGYQLMGIERAIVCSAFTGRYLTALGFSAPVDVLRPALDRVFLGGAATRKPKRLQIAYMPRKLPIESRFVQGLFKARHPHLCHIPWVPISGMSLEECAAVLSESAVFAAFGHLEGLGLPPLEAMACGCVVGGFHGGGGLEYANASNGFWANSGDLEGCADAIASAVEAAQDPVRRQLLSQAAKLTLEPYNASRFDEAFDQAWNAILGERRDWFLLGSD